MVEIGCGIGRLTGPLAARGASVRALGVSPRMLALAREHNPGLASVGAGTQFCFVRLRAQPSASA